VLVRVTRWFMIGAPVVAGILVLILGTAGSISTTFGIVLIGIGPIIWMWNWLIRMSFDEEDHLPSAPPGRTPPGPEPQRLHRHQVPRHPRGKPTRAPRRRS
jgi:hypothetical protein